MHEILSSIEIKFSKENEEICEESLYTRPENQGSKEFVEDVQGKINDILSRHIEVQGKKREQDEEEESSEAPYNDN